MQNITNEFTERKLTLDINWCQDSYYRKKLKYLSVQLSFFQQQFNTVKMKRF